MRFSIDPKPIGAFIEYTLKPLIDDSRELVEILGEHNIKLGDLINHAFRIYIFDAIMRFITNVTVTGLICVTAWYCLHTAK